MKWTDNSGEPAPAFFPTPFCGLLLCLVLNGTDNRITHTTAMFDKAESG